MINEANRIQKYSNKTIGLLLLIVSSVVVFIAAAFFETFFENVTTVSAFLTCHNLFEFFSVLVSFSIFIIIYYTYDSSNSVRFMFLCCAFYIMGVLDIFHTLSFKGMPDFFIPNSSANRATTFWIISRVIGNILVLLAFVMPAERTSKIKKEFFVIAANIIVFLTFFIATYYPNALPAMYVDGIGLTKTKIYLEYFIILLMVIILIIVLNWYKNSGMFHVFQFAMGYVLCIFSEFAFVSYGSVYDVYNFLGHIYKFIGFFILFKSIFSYSIRLPYREMEKARNEMKHYSEKLNFLVKRRTKELEEINEKLMIDLEYARDIQRCLLPSKMPDDIAVSFDAGYMPAERLSGDFYNVIKLDDNNIAVYIGDVAGHGVSAAMLTVFANQNIKPVREIAEDSVEIISPGYTLKGLYKAFNKTNFKDETYLVMVCGIYNTQTRCFTYASAGINVSPLIIKRNGEISEMDVKGFAICKLGEIIMPYYEDRSLQLEAGDKILFYTDGLVEAENPKGGKYTYKNLINVIKNNYRLSGNSLVQVIKRDFFKLIGEDEKLKDDVTFLVMEVN